MLSAEIVYKCSMPFETKNEMVLKQTFKKKSLNVFFLFYKLNKNLLSIGV